MARSTLTCVERLTPPAKSIGKGDNRIWYSPRQPAWQCAFSSSGNYLAVCYGAPAPCIRIWEYLPNEHASERDQKMLRKIVEEENPGKQGDPAVSGEEDTVNNEEQDAVNNVDEDDDQGGKEVGGGGGQWRLHTTLSGIHTRTIRSLAFAPSHVPLLLASASFDGSVGVWECYPGNQKYNELNHWECAAQLEGHDNEVKCVVWNRTGSLLATCGRDKTVWIWECFLPGAVGGPCATPASRAGEFECLAVLNGHEADVKCVVFANSLQQWGEGDDILLSCSYDDTIKIWAEEDGDWFCAMTLADIHSSTIWTLAVAPSQVRVISGSADASLAIHQCFTYEEALQHELIKEGNTQSNKNAIWKCVGRLPDAHVGTVYSVDCAPAKAGHGRIASVGTDGRVQIYRETRESTSSRPVFALDCAARIRGAGEHFCVRWHPVDSSLLATASEDGTVRLWKFTQN